MITREAAQSLIMLLLALAGLILGLVPQLLLYFSLERINNLFVLLFSVYSVFFVSLAFAALGAAWAARKSDVRPPVPGLRVALVIEAAGLSALWYRLINPFPIGPLLENGQYAALLPLVLVLLAGWFFFLFILKKIL